MEFTEKKVLVFGTGISGVAACPAVKRGRSSDLG